MTDDEHKFLSQRVARLEKDIKELLNAMQTLIQTQGEQNTFNQRVMHALELDRDMGHA